jgi:hypothetical protein
MPRHERWIWVSLLVLGAALLWFCADARAAMIDYDRTANGADQPFSNLVRDTPVPWELFADEHVTGPTGDRENYLPTDEPSREVADKTLGEVLFYSDVDGRSRRVIYDVFASLPVATIYFLDPFYAPNSPSFGPASASVNAVSIGGAPDVSSGAVAAAGFVAAGIGNEVIPVPEPGIALMLLPAAVGWLIRRPRVRR